MKKPRMGISSSTMEKQTGAIKRFDLPLAFVEWAALAQDRAVWCQRVTEPPFATGKPFVRIPRGDSRATPEEKLRAEAQCAAEAA